MVVEIGHLKKREVERHGLVLHQGTDVILHEFRLSSPYPLRTHLCDFRQYEDAAHEQAVNEYGLKILERQTATKRSRQRINKQSCQVNDGYGQKTFNKKEEYPGSSPSFRRFPHEAKGSQQMRNILEQLH